MAATKADFCARRKCEHHVDRHAPNGGRCLVCECDRLAKNRPRVLVGKESSAYLEEVLSNDIDALWQERSELVARGEPVTDINRDLRHARRLLESIRGVREDFGWA